MALVMLTPQPGREVSLNSDRRSVFLAPVGTVEIFPAGAELFASWKTAKENLLMALAPDELARIASLEYGREDFELQPVETGHVDPRALLLAKLIKDELADRTPNQLYLDSLITVFSTYLLRNYSTLQDRAGPRSRGGLSPKAWRDVRDYIRANISRQLSIGQLASVAGLSPSHFLRAFRQTAGQAPHQNVLAIRLELAEKLAATTDLPFAEIASLAGFASHSHMTASMRRYRSTTPSGLRRARIIR